MKKLLISLAAALSASTAMAQTSGAQAPAPATTPAPAATSAPAAAAPLPDADPALWVLRDADTTIYLFGTVHMLDGRRDWFNDEVRTAFDRSTELVVEADLPSDPAAQQQTMMPIVMRYAVDPQGRTLTSRLNEADRGRLQQAIAATGAPAAAFDRFEPWFVGMTLAALAAQRAGMQPEHGVETVLKGAGRARNVTVSELEGIDRQMQMLDSMPEATQLAFLRASLDSLDRAEELAANMQSAWYDGDVDRLARIMNEGMGTAPELYDIMLSNRNRAWAEWIDGRMDRPGTVFVAVGAGHLGGRNSVQDYLRERGFRTERVAAAN